MCLRLLRQRRVNYHSLVASVVAGARVTLLLLLVLSNPMPMGVRPRRLGMAKKSSFMAPMALNSSGLRTKSSKELLIAATPFLRASARSPPRIASSRLARSMMFCPKGSCHICVILPSVVGAAGLRRVSDELAIVLIQRRWKTDGPQNNAISLLMAAATKPNRSAPWGRISRKSRPKKRPRAKL